MGTRPVIGGVGSGSGHDPLWNLRLLAFCSVCLCMFMYAIFRCVQKKNEKDILEWLHPNKGWKKITLKSTWWLPMFLLKSLFQMQKVCYAMGLVIFMFESGRPGARGILRYGSGWPVQGVGTSPNGHRCRSAGGLWTQNNASSNLRDLATVTWGPAEDHVIDQIKTVAMPGVDLFWLVFDMC